MRFQVLGPVRAGDAVLAPKPRALLAVLLAVRGRPVTVDRLLAELWPDGTPPTATATLQMHVSALRKAVGDRLRTVPAGYRLDLTADVLDAAEFERTGALDLWRGDAYDDVPAGPAVAADAARLAELRLDARRRWAEAALADGRHAEAVTELTGWAAAEPTTEPLVRQLMLALYRCGRAGDALIAYQRTVAALAELETVPSPALDALAEAVRRQDPTLDAPVPGVPARPNRFIGRRAELDRAAGLLGTARLLTVAGPGGAGKTRLSLELARALADGHDAVHVVELAEHRDGPLDTRLAAAIGAREEPGTPLLATITRRLDGRTLLILDNCEHVRAESAALAGTLLAAAPGLRIVATSRERLGLDGEVVFTLDGLAAPDAVRLLADRVAAVRGGAALTAAEHAVADELCRRLDGLPLAIELAAARLRALPLSEIMSRLDRRLDLLTGTAPVARHQTMRAAIDWGYDLLDLPQQELLRRLGVFGGGFDLAAAGEVAGTDPLDPLTQLVDRSMIEWRDGRYRLIETIREYARDRLGPAERADAYTRLARLCENRLATPPPVDGPAHTAWLAGISADHDTITAAIDWALRDGDAAQGLRIAAAMWWYWWVAGRMAEGRAWLGRALGAGPPEASASRAAALRAAASLARNSGDLTAARRLGEECLSVLRSLDGAGRRGLPAALNNLLITAQAQEDYPASLEFGYEALRIAEELSDARMIAAASNNTAGTLRCLGRLDEAEELFTRALAGFRALHDRRGEAAALSNLSTAARRRGRYPDARTAMREALAVYTELGIVEGQLDAIEGLAQLDVLDGDPAAGLRLLAVAERERSALGAPSFTPDEIADRARAEELARARLGAAAVGRVYREATGTTLEAAVAGLLGG
ncbi:BTAD domain-containing putative transcriptional regulator [Catenuloplanes indicus]|uniref:ATPase/DNA-binding SARP family transcriptional activator n=1 Tax=Catenuloplanes indicus TaxID=137267 RepID=A0AAE4B0D2_9ACTN|nr:BTAD domain-containing putative transcriptional regulator [Catenuloplanes indicus]MDQ0366708.1 putative ATPase/DNA-binding SARP family transcriptional activator [Catenuloplanes indicus]